MLCLTLNAPGGGKRAQGRAAQAIPEGRIRCDLVLTPDKGVQLFVNKQQVIAAAWENAPDGKPWDATPDIAFGGRIGEKYWDGRIGGILAHKGTDLPEIEIPPIPDVPRSVVEATLLEITEPPTLENMTAYSRALVENYFHVEKTVEGNAISGNIIIASWAVMEKRMLTPGWQKGKRYTLMIEPFSSYPWLESEMRCTQITDMDADVYYCVDAPAPFTKK
jgi:hypothetical protein